MLNNIIGGVSPVKFNLRSGNTTPFKMMGSSPTKFLGGVFGGGGGSGMFMGGNWISRMREKHRAIRARHLANINKTKGMQPGVGGDGAHTHGTGGEAIGGTQAGMVAQGGAAPEVPVEPEEGGMVAASDRKLKRNISLISKSPSGLNIYTFKYKEEFGVGDSTYTGVMADEVPEYAVVHRDDYDMVDYSKIDVDFRKL